MSRPGITIIDAAQYGNLAVCDFCGYTVPEKAEMAHYPTCMTKRMTISQAQQQIEEWCTDPDAENKDAD